MTDMTDYNDSVLPEQAERRLTLLVIDDDPSTILILNKMLSDEYDLQFALSARQAFQLLELSTPDLVLLDISMPDMNGIEVCRRLRAHAEYAALPVIFVTSHTQDDDQVEALDAGGSDFITKPLHSAVVKARIRLHIRLKLQHEILTGYVYLDGLTNLHNRRKLDETMAAEWRRCRRLQLPLAVMMIDIDLFKRYNDHYGHLQGDSCLRAVATAIASCFHRSHDVVARYGGEEFCCVMPETGLPAALAKAQALLEAIRALHLPHAASSIASEVTMSIGVAACIPADEPWGDLLEEADRQLYAAKTTGRNKVMPVA